MAVPFGNRDFILSAEQVAHINDRHVDVEKAPKASKFYEKFNLTATLALLTHRIRPQRDEVKLIKSGVRRRHGTYYLYVCQLEKVIGACLWGFPSKEICIYYSYSEKYPDKFRIISAYPFSIFLPPRSVRSRLIFSCTYVGQWFSLTFFKKYLQEGRKQTKILTLAFAELWAKLPMFLQIHIIYH